MSQAERLKKVINSLYESSKSFSEGIGLGSPTTIYDILSGKRHITPALLKAIIETHTNLNPEWLLEGKGEMYLHKNQNNNTSELNETKVNYGCSCPECKEKDEEILRLKNEVIEAQKQYIECLKEVSAIRKATSG
jgi:hypothetical protein